MKTTTELLEHLYPGANQVEKIEPTQKQINLLKLKISNITGINPVQIKQSSRKRELVLSRQLFSIAMKVFTSYSLSQIAEKIDKDHATVYTSIKSALGPYDTDPGFRKTLNQALNAASQVFNLEFKRPENHQFTLLSKEFWKYAVLSQQKGDNISQNQEIEKLHSIVRDREREIRLLRGQIERLKLKNSYQFA